MTAFNVEHNDNDDELMTVVVPQGTAKIAETIEEFITRAKAEGYDVYVDGELS